jgi:hypothetical protein
VTVLETRPNRVKCSPLGVPSGEHAFSETGRSAAGDHEVGDRNRREHLDEKVKELFVRSSN